MKTIETKRLIIRNFIESDLNDFFEYASVEGVGEDAGWVHHKNIEITKSILQNFIKTKNEYAILYKENNKVIGSIGIYEKIDVSFYENYHQKEIGYVLSKEYWGKGLMTEVVKAVIDYLFTDPSIDGIWCTHFDFNHRSRRVIEKCGFKFIRNEISDVKQLNKRYKSRVYCLTKLEYLQANEGEK